MRSVWFGLLLFAVLGSTAPALEVASVQAHCLAPLVRDGARLPVRVDLMTTGTGLRQGRLRLDLREDQADHGSVWGPPMVLSAGKRSQVLLLPPIVGTDVYLRLTVHSSLVLDDGTTIRGESDQLELRSDVALVAAVLHDPYQSAKELLDGIRAIDSKVTDKKVLLQLLPTSLSIAELPQQAWAYAGWDVVIARSIDLRQCPERRLRALRDWLRRGGRLLCLGAIAELPTGFKELFHGAGKELAGGRARRLGLGRLAIVPQLPSELDAEAQEALAAWLWQERDPASEPPPEEKQWREDSRDLLQDIDVRRVPVAWSLGLLIAFLVVIGPLDWWLIGRLCGRGSTWITLPMAAVATTVGFVLVTRGFLGSEDHHAQVHLIDADATGVIAERLLHLRFRPFGSRVTAVGSGRFLLIDPPQAGGGSGIGAPSYRLREDGGEEFSFQLNERSTVLYAEVRGPGGGHPWLPLLPATAPGEPLLPPLKDIDGVAPLVGAAWLAPAGAITEQGFRQAFIGRRWRRDTIETFRSSLADLLLHLVDRHARPLLVRQALVDWAPPARPTGGCLCWVGRQGQDLVVLRRWYGADGR